MSRERFIDPAIWSSEQFCEVGHDAGRDARLLFIGCITWADDCGFLPASLHRLKVKVFPSDNDVTKDDIRRLLAGLARTGLVQIYPARVGNEDQEVIWLPGFFGWQPLKWRSKSKYLQALVDAGRFRQELDEKGRVASCSPVLPGPAWSSLVLADPDNVGKGPKNSGEGRGVVSSRVVGCGGEGMKTPPLTFDVSVTGASDLPGSKGPDVPGQTPLVPADPGPHVTFTEAKDTATSTEGLGSSDPDGDGHDAPKDDDHVTTPLTSGIVSIWEENGEHFGQTKALRAFVQEHDKANPVHLLAHVREIDQSAKIKHKMRALFDRLRGKKKLEPSDEAKKWASEKLNGGPAEEKSQPEPMTDIMPGNLVDTGKPKKPHPAVLKMFEDLTDGWPEDALNEDGARQVSSALLALRPAFVIAHCRDINARGDLTPYWTDLRGRLGAVERPPEKLFTEAGVDIEEAMAAKV